MKNNKSEKANHKNRKGLFLKIGVVVSLTFVLWTLNWVTNERVNLLENAMSPSIVCPIGMDINPEIESIRQIIHLTRPIKYKAKQLTDEAIPVSSVDVKPTFNGGDIDKFGKWVNSRVVYPAEAQEANISGIVYLSFDIGVDGILTNLKILRGIDPILDDEALRVVKLSPRWKPGRQQGKTVTVSYQFPVKFRQDWGQNN